MSAANGTAPGKRNVSIELTPSQIPQIIHSTLAVPGTSSSRTRPLIGLRGGSSSTSSPHLYYDKKLARSVIEGLVVLCASADCREPSIRAHPLSGQTLEGPDAPLKGTR
jgi:hypothetical protein